jgi:hypothetical protein
VSNTPEEAFESFTRHWQERSTEFCMHDQKVRDDLMSLVASTMVLLNQCPQVFPEFIKQAECLMLTLTPPDVKKRIFEATQL